MIVLIMKLGVTTGDLYLPLSHVVLPVWDSLQEIVSTLTPFSCYNQSALSLLLSCSQILGKITPEGVFLEQLETDPGQYLPPITESSLSGEVVDVSGPCAIGKICAVIHTLATQES